MNTATSPQPAARSNAALVMRPREAAQLLGISMTTLHRLRVAGEFIKPIQLGTQAIGFRRVDIDAWLDTRPVCARFTETLEF